MTTAKKKAATKSAPKTEEPKETKAEKFKRVGGLRVSNALDKIRLIQKLSNVTQYEYTEEDVDKMAEALADTVKATIQPFYDALQGKKDAGGGGGFQF